MKDAVDMCKGLVSPVIILASPPLWPKQYHTNFSIKNRDHRKLVKDFVFLVSPHQHFTGRYPDLKWNSVKNTTLPPEFLNYCFTIYIYIYTYHNHVPAINK